MSRSRAAAIDLGSNNCKMLAVERAEDGLPRALAPYTQRPVTEGEQSWTHTVAEYATAVEEYLGWCRATGVAEIHLVATAWLRARVEAEREEFCRTIATRTGLTVEIVSAEQEAEYELRAILLDRPAEPFVVLKIGGRSTEVVLKPNGRPPVYPACALGGTRTLMPEFDQDRPMPEELHSALVAEIRQELGPIAGLVQDRLGDGRDRRPSLDLIAYGGTASELPYLDREIPRTERDRPGRSFADLNMHRISTKRLAEIERRYRSMNLERRRRDPFLDPERANHILVAAALFQTAAELLEVPQVAVNTRPMVWGILAGNRV